VTHLSRACEHLQHERKLLERRISELKHAVATVRTILSQQQRRRSRLRERDYAAASALLDALCTSAPPEAAASIPHMKFWPSSLSTARPPVCCNATEPSRSLTHKARPLRRVSAFAEHAALWYQAVSDAAGGLAMADMSPNMGLHVRACRTALASRMCCPASDVCWHLQLGHEVAPGVQLSCSCQLGSVECSNSFLLFWLLSMLESAFLADEADALQDAVSNGVQASVRTCTLGVDRPTTQATAVVIKCRAALTAMYSDRLDMRMIITVLPNRSNHGAPLTMPCTANGVQSHQHFVHAPRVQHACGASVCSNRSLLLACAGDHESRNDNARKPIDPLQSPSASSCTSVPAVQCSETPCMAAAVRCGVNERLPASDALRHAVPALLSKFAARVPRRAFWTRCEQFQRFLDDIQPQLNVSKAVDSCMPVDAEDVFFNECVSGNMILLQGVTNVYANTLARLRDPTETVVRCSALMPALFNTSRVGGRVRR
jgi:hypothetical protein